MVPTSEAQATDTVLMVRPAHFGSNAETAATNAFQRPAADNASVATEAQREFAGLALRLASAGVRVLEFAGRTDAALPDEVFPNNWLSLHGDGTAVLYPLLASNRRQERRLEFLTALQTEHGYRITRTVDLTALEARGEFLEGTGSLVLDRTRKVAYACWSPRTHVGPLAEFGRTLGYEMVPFHAVDRSGKPIYHTNVVLSLGTRFAALATSAITIETERSLRERLEATGREVIELDGDQLDAFAGNILELRGARGPIVALSATALASLDSAQCRALERHGELVSADIRTIERVGGGGVRCMLAEVALPRAR